jgi:DNA-binding MarR family transcriptional regulator
VNAESRPHQGLDPVIHAPLRLTLMSALAGVDSADFPTLRDVLQISDSALSKQLAILESAGYIEITKGRAGRRPRTWAALTPLGRTSLQAHIAALRAITDLATNPAGRAGQQSRSAQ